MDQIRDVSEVNDKIALSDLTSLEERWSKLKDWSSERNVFLQETLAKWKTFKDKEEALIGYIDEKQSLLKELDAPVNVANENAVDERLNVLKVN